MLLTHVLFGCHRTPPAPKSKSLMSGKSTKSGHEQVTFPMAKTTQKTAGKSTEKSAEKPAKRTHSAEVRESQEIIEGGAYGRDQDAGRYREVS
ncbi:hypothetical protein L596_028340 [Steinernema carpocapsae]|uniref:Uncharacterized protein n=1 Tax=Steinernema carpocapsae TaxID=34508 RepID=A0A4U5LY55_STECR|nr:hypothetical protein L596_028340 [Steinernema carpocapsae]